MITFNSMIYQHDGQYFRFTRQTDKSLTCHICQWHGGVEAETAALTSTYRAFVEQKYPPYGRIWADEPLASEKLAMKWVAEQLLKD